MTKSDYKKFSAVAGKLHTLQDEDHHTKKAKICATDKSIGPFRQYSYLLQELKTLKKEVIDSRIRETRSLIANNKPLLKLSCFELMEYNFRENTHSNVLRYLFDYRMNGPIGTKILTQFIVRLQRKEAIEISHLVRLKQYTVDREKSVEGGRMDLLIQDDKNKFVIVLENKIYANVGQRGELDEDSEPVTQLKVYQRYVERNYKSYRPLYVLLSYKQIEKDHSPFIPSDYSILYKIIKSFPSDDIIVNQYRLLLHSLVHNITNKYKILRQISSLNTIKNIDINTLEIINGVLYERS